MKPLILEHKVITVDARGSLQSRDALTGKVEWKKQLKKRVNSGVSGDDEKLFLGLADGSLMALDAKNGDKLWQTSLDKNILSTGHYDGKNVYVQTADGTLSSLQSNTGKLNWEYKALVPDLTLYSTSSPIVWNNMVIAGFANGKIMAFNKSNGTPLWDYQVAMPSGRSSIQRMVDINSTPVIVDNALYAVSYQGNMVAIDLSNGDELWRYNVSSITDFTINNKYVYVSDTEGTVWALNRDNGRVLWQQPNLHMRNLSGTAFIDNTVIVGDYAGYFHGLAKDDGGFVARSKLGASGIRVAPQVKNDIIYVLDNSGWLAAYKLA